MTFGARRLGRGFAAIPAALLLWTVLVASATLGVVASAQSEGPVVGFYLFYSETCPHCHEIMEDYLPTVYATYGDRVVYQYFNLRGSNDNVRTMLALETQLGVPDELQGYVPALVIGDQVLIGSDEIRERLEGLIDGYLAEGGVDFASLDDLPEIVLPTPEPVVQIRVLFDPQSEAAQQVQTLLSDLYETYGSQFYAYAVDTTQEQIVEMLGPLHDTLGVDLPAPGTPEVQIDRRLLVGLDEIQSELPDLVKKGLAEGGVGLLSWEELVGQPVTKQPIWIAYFEQAGCQECARTTYFLQVVQEQFPQVEVETFPIEDAENKALNEWLSAEHNVPEEKRLTTPMLFVGDDVLIGEEATLDNLLAVVDRYAESGAERTWAEFDASLGRQSLLDRFNSFGLITVLGAGLIDGLNPCAFATLVFFVSYMAFTGRRGRDILLVGLSFTVGVFLTYLLVGVGLLRVVQSLSFFTALGRWVYLLTALLCAILAAFTIRDFRAARQGEQGDMTLRLPMGIRRRIHRVIRESAQMRAFVVIALVTGFVVSLLELACTGQVYLPTIMFVLSVPEMAARAFLYLFLYCVMFVIPLIVVFLLSYFGTTSEQLGAFVGRHTASIKLVTALVFVGLALWMTWTMAPLFGIDSPWNWVLMAGVALLILTGAAMLQIRRQRIERRTSRKRRRTKEPARKRAAEVRTSSRKRAQRSKKKQT